jgi:hypothetical protein
MIGFGANPPRNPHHRTAHGSWSNNINEPADSRHILYGALVGGPTAPNDQYSDRRQDYQMNEVATDYNAGLTSALVRMYAEFGGTPLANFPPAEEPDGPEMYVESSLNATGSNFSEAKVLIYNKSAWPARALTNGSFRYYFTLDGDTTPSQITLSTAYNQCSAPTGPTQYSGRVYYVTVSCAGQVIAPQGQSEWRREVQFRISSSGSWDPTNDWSYRSATTQAQNPNITLFDGSTQVWGNAPTGSPSPSVSPSSSPSPSVSPSTSPSTSPSVSPSPSPSGNGAACRVSYATNDWNTGFTANITITNTGTTTLDGWTLRFTFPGAQQIGQGWSAVWSQSGANVTATNMSYNGILEAGDSISIGFNGTHSGSNPLPTSFSLNGIACT